MAANDPAGQPAPPGGFENLGWYSGYQYYQGSFAPQAGQIHPSSPQVGAGQDVSSEVMRQTSVAAGLEPGAHEAWVQSQRALQSAGDVTPYLNQYQDGVYAGLEAPPTKIPTMAELKSELLPEGGYPAPLDRVGKFEEMRATYGVADLEKSLTDVKAQIEEEYAIFRKQRGIEEGKPVPLGVIAGRISEEERAAQERVDFLGRQQARITDELNTKYSLISTYMNLMSLDYQDAISRYETEFEINVKVYDLIAGLRREARSAYESDRDAARANLQIYMNALTAGNVDYSSLSADQRLMVNKLEAQSGLPIGFMSTVRKDPGADIIFTTSNEGVTQVGIRNPDGSISVQSYGTRISGAAGGGTVAERTAGRAREAYAEINDYLTELGGEDLYVSPDEWQYVRSAWAQQGYDVGDFDDAFRDRFIGVPEERGWSIEQFGLE